jgi:hypothetical protein
MKAGINTKSKTVLIFEKGKSQMQYLAESLASKVTTMLDNNERMIEHVKGEKIYSDSKKSSSHSFIPAYKRNMGKDHTKFK